MILSDVFADIEPIPQDDGPHPVCAIDYPLAYVEAMGYLRAIMRADEHSGTSLQSFRFLQSPFASHELLGWPHILLPICLLDRAFKLTSICLRFNPANYTNWHFRRQILASLSTAPEESRVLNLTFYDLEKIENDLDFTAQIGGNNPKNYQIWYHRRNLLEYAFSNIKNESLELVRKELDYVAGVFEVDGKNYHVSTFCCCNWCHIRKGDTFLTISYFPMLMFVDRHGLIDNGLLN